MSESESKKPRIVRSSRPSLRPVGGPVDGPNPFAGLVEACEQTASQYQPERAKDLVGWFGHLGDAVEAFGSMLAAMAEANRDNVLMDPAAEEYGRQLAVSIMRFRDHCDDAYAIFLRVHAEELAKWENPHWAAWDVTKNTD